MRQTFACQKSWGGISPASCDAGRESGRGKAICPAGLSPAGNPPYFAKHGSAPSHPVKDADVFWLISSLAVVAVSLVLWRSGLARAGGDDTPAAEYDLQIYRDQLDELERDVARGTLGAEEAGRARVEIQRRILAADRQVRAARTRGAQNRTATLSLGLAILAMVAASYVTYALIGAPGARDLPLAERIAGIEAARAGRASQAEVEAARAAPLNAPPGDIAAEVAELRQVLEARTDDTEGLAILARTEANLGNYRAARLAQGRLLGALEAQGATPPEILARAEADLAELMILAAGGYVSPEAEAALTGALARVPELGQARYSLGLMYAQQGRPDLAFPIWQRLLGDSAPGDPWLSALERDIERVAVAAGVDPALIAMAAPRPASPAPDMNPAAAIANLPAAERQAAIEGMVERLSERLATEGGPAQDWARLVRALTVLERADDARAIAAEARDVFADSPDARALIDRAVAPLGEDPAP